MGRSRPSGSRGWPANSPAPWTPHAHGLVHRDVKPANTLLSGAGEDEHALLTDFGLTKEATGQSGLTATGQLLGTLDYVAPEQLDGREVDARTDIYALGCLLFECLTGHPPFAGTPAAKMYAHLHTPPPAVEGLAPALGVRVDEALGRAMAKEPAQRFPSAGDLGRALAAAVQGRANAAPERSVAVGPAATQVGALGATVIDRPPPPPPRLEPRSPAAPMAATSEPAPAPRRRTGLLVGAAAALLLVGGGVGAAFALIGGDDDADPPPTTAAAQEPAAAPAPEPREPEPPEPAETQTPPQADGPAFAPFTPASGAYTVEAPASDGWSSGPEEAVNSRLDRVTWTGPGGETVWVDSTPADRPEFRREGKDVLEERTVPQEAFGSMQEFVFTGEPDFCAAQTCVVLQIDPGDGSGYGIIGGGGDAEEAIRVARRMGTSLEP